MHIYVAFYLIYERNGMKGMCLIDGLHLRQYYFPCTARITTAFRALLCYRIVSKNEIKKQEQFAVMKIVLPQQAIAEIIYFCWFVGFTRRILPLSVFASLFRNNV